MLLMLLAGYHAPAPLVMRATAGPVDQVRGRDPRQLDGLGAPADRVRTAQARARLRGQATDRTRR